ncbi:hypothetical protein F2Q68_00041729 [Brassica cretica]|uniref:RING-type E3 ubiquitin transferase n=1 Tax=Brassica cretica TaxID=69181 RepID=A0A8S9MMW7_BRACR|nr:hypothetical protein F2Q68_00041729 [Brassica cretica]
MSFAGNSTESSVAAVESEKMFFCHQCNQIITISITSSADPLCPLCNLGFLEEYADPTLIQSLISSSQSQIPSHIPPPLHPSHGLHESRSCELHPQPSPSAPIKRHQRSIALVAFLSFVDFRVSLSHLDKSYQNVKINFTRPLN